MEVKIQGLVELMDQAIELAQQRLDAKRAGHVDPASEEGLGQIIRGLKYRRNEALNAGYEVSDSRLACLARRLNMRCQIRNACVRLAK